MRNGKIGIIFILSMAWLSSGCVPKGKAAELLAPKKQLYYRANMFNKFLRWKAFQRAKMLVLPQKRPSFIVQCERDRPHLRITDYKVRDVTEIKEGKEAIVLVVIHRHRLPSVSVKRVMEQQRWKSKNGNWFFFGVEPTKKKSSS